MFLAAAHTLVAFIPAGSVFAEDCSRRAVIFDGLGILGKVVVFDRLLGEPVFVFDQDISILADVCEGFAVLFRDSFSEIRRE